MNQRHESLTESQEMLLSKHFDRETSMFERYTVRRLLSRSNVARKYLDSLEATRSIVRDVVPDLKPSLWTRVSARIHSEERSEVFLGRREYSPVSVGFFQSLFSRGSLAAMATIAALVLVLPSSRKGGSDFTNQTTGRTVQIQKGLPLAAPASIGVDWMRSDGRLQVMHDPDERAPVIFVKRRYSRGGPILRNDRNSQGIIMQSGRSVPEGITVHSQR